MSSLFVFSQFLIIYIIQHVNFMGVHMRNFCLCLHVLKISNIGKLVPDIKLSQLSEVRCRAPLPLWYFIFDLFFNEHIIKGMCIETKSLQVPGHFSDYLQSVFHHFDKMHEIAPKQRFTFVQSFKCFSPWLCHRFVPVAVPVHPGREHSRGSTRQEPGSLICPGGTLPQQPNFLLLGPMT